MLYAICMKKWLKPANDWCNKYEWIVFLFLLVIVLRLPSLFAPHHYGDEEIYFVMGRAWRAGVGMYSAAFDHKPPLIYVIAGITQSVFWFRMVLMVWMLAHTLIFWKLAKRFWGGIRPKMAYVSSLIFVVLTSIPTLEGNIANAELFMMMPVSLSLLLLLNKGKATKLNYLVSGLIAGVGLLFKVPVIFDFIAIVLYLFAFEKKSFADGARSLISPKLWLFLIGFFLPIIASIINYQLKGVGADYIRAAVLVNFGYVSSWKTGSTAFNPLQSGLVVRGMILAIYTVVLYLLRKKLGKEYVLALLWFGYSVFGALLSARPYPHYLIQPMAPLALLVPFVFVIDNVMSWIAIGFVVVMGSLVQRNIGFWAYPTIPIYQNFWNYATGKLTKTEYRNTFPSAKMNYAIAEYLNQRMTPKDNLFVWSSDVAVYNLTDKLLSGGKYMVDFHVRDWKAFDEVMTNLKISQPEYVVLLPNPMPFPELTDMLNLNYFLATKIEGAEIWRKL